MLPAADPRTPEDQAALRAGTAALENLDLHDLKRGWRALTHRTPPPVP